jgi:hypothetical protein
LFRPDQVLYIDFIVQYWIRKWPEKNSSAGTNSTLYTWPIWKISISWHIWIYFRMWVAHDPTYFAHPWSSSSGNKPVRTENEFKYFTNLTVVLDITYQSLIYKIFGNINDCQRYHEQVSYIENLFSKVNKCFFIDFIFLFWIGYLYGHGQWFSKEEKKARISTNCTFSITNVCCLLKMSKNSPTHLISYSRLNPKIPAHLSQ